MGSERSPSPTEATESQLVLQRDRLSTVLKTASTGLCLVDSENQIVEINRAAAELLRISPAQAHGFNLLTLLGTTETTPADGDLAGLQSSIRIGSPWHGEAIEIAVSEQTRKVCNIDFIPLGSDGNNAGGVLAFHDLSDRKRDSERIEWVASHDPLTGLMNRSAIASHIDGFQLRADADEPDCALLFIDLDHFKTVNETAGHDVGDAVLVDAANRIRACVRHGDVVARVGGDEFVVFFEQTPHPDALALLAERILMQLRMPFAPVGEQMHLSASLGMVTSQARETSANSLLRDADIALYQAKESGRDQAVRFDEELRKRIQRRVDLDRKLRSAVTNRELSVAFQPMIEIGTGRVLGFETLARWFTDDGPIGPDEFIPAAEANGLITDIGKMVLDESISMAAEIGAQAPEWPSAGMVVAVNVSGAQLAGGGFAETVAQGLASANVPASAIALELTESSLVSYGDAAWQELTAARELGVHIALDDFGTGWSSLSVLQNFPIDCIKIDRSFVNGMVSESKDYAIVESIIALGRAMGHAVVAEGVEETTQAEALEELGCVVAQGYFYARPMTKQDALTFLASQRQLNGPLVASQRSAPRRTNSARARAAS